MGTAIAIWLFGTIIFFFILYNVIRSAVDDSNLAKNIKDIKDILLKKQMESIKTDDDVDDDNDEDLNEECPACGRKVKQNETFCPECGLKLIDEKEN